MAAASAVARIALRGGTSIPQIGLGTWQLTGDDAYKAVLAALRAGYRHVDSAAVYRNEEQVGKAVRDSGIPRDELFITTKLQPRDHGEGAYAACVASLAKLGMDYVDLYLIHWPGVAGRALDDPGIRDVRRVTWEAMQRLHAEKKARAVGVSNFMAWHIEELVTAPWCSVLPAVNQIELHPLLQQREAVAACEKHGIVVEAYSSLARGAPQLLEAPQLRAAAEAHGVTTSQVALRWALQRGYVIIPKSSKPERIAANMDVLGFTLTAEEMDAITALETADTRLRTCWDPTTVKV